MSFINNLSRQALSRNVLSAVRTQSRGVATTSNSALRSSSIRSGLAFNNKTTNQVTGSLLTRRFISETSVRSDGGLNDPPEDGIHPEQSGRMDL